MIIFNGQDLKKYFDKILDIRRDILPPRSIQFLEVPGRAGSYFANVREESRIIEVDVFMKDQSFEALRSRIRQAAEILDTDEPAPLVISDEPDKVWMGILMEDTALEEVIYTGRTTLRFFIPDPYAEAIEEKQKLISKKPPVFERQSTACTPEGTVLPGEPRYLEGKFKQAIFIEEGTTNHLQSAENPTTEEVEVEQGTTYTLQHEMGTVQVEHKQVEDLEGGEMDRVTFRDGALELEKHGVDTREELSLIGGTYDQTEYDDDSVKLGKEHEGDTSLEESEQDDAWVGGQNNNVKVENNHIELSNLPQWDYHDDMKDYLGTGWEPRLNPELITQTANTVRMDSYIGESGAATALVKETPPGAVVRTVDLLYWLTDPPGAGYDPTAPNRMRFILVLDYIMPDTDNRYAAFYPVLFEESDIEGTFPGYAWVRCVVTRLPTAGDAGNIDIYINGEYSRSLQASGTTLTTPRLQFIMENQDQGRFFLADVKYSTEVLHPTQPSFPFPLEGSRESPEYDLSHLGEYRGGSATNEYELNHDLPARAEPYEHQVEMETNIYKNGAWQGWKKPNGGLPDLEVGESLKGVKVKLRNTLKTYDYYLSPYLLDSRLTVEGYRSDYYQSGTWTTEVDLSSVVRASSAILNYETEEPEGTQVIAEVALKEGDTIGDWVEVGDGQAIPQIDKNIDLTTTTLLVRFTLTTTDTEITPRVLFAQVDAVSAYHDEGICTFPLVDLSSIGEATGSEVETTAMTPDGTNIITESQWNDGDWLPAIDSIPQIHPETNLSGVSQRLRVRLQSNTQGDETPKVSGLWWKIGQKIEDGHWFNLVPATPILVLTPSGVYRWQLEKNPYPTTFHPDTRAPETLYLPIDPDLIGDEGTVSFWAYEDGSDRERYMIDTDGGNRNSIYRTESSYKVRINNDDALEIPIPPIGFNKIAIRWYESKIDAFINGQMVASQDLPEPVSFDGASRLFIGSDRDGENQMNERIDDFHISSIARSDEYLANVSTPEDVDDETLYLFRFDHSLADESTMVVNEGTAPTLPWFEGIVKQSLDHLKILHNQSGQFLLLNSRFNEGDHIILGKPESPVMVNGQDRKNILSLESDFFELVKGENTFEVTDGVDLTMHWKERWK